MAVFFHRGFDLLFFRFLNRADCWPFFLRGYFFCAFGCFAFVLPLGPASANPIYIIGFVTFHQGKLEEIRIVTSRGFAVGGALLSVALALVFMGGFLVLSGGGDKTLRLWSMETGEEIKLNPNEIKNTYQTSMVEYKKELMLKCGQYKIDFVEADINKGLENVLMPYLLKRTRML